MVNLRNFPGANVDDIWHNLMPIIREKPNHLIIHAGTNEAKCFTSKETLDQFLKILLVNMFQIVR